VNGYQIFGGINYNGMTMGIPLILEAGDIISRTNSTGIGYNVTFNGILINNNENIDVVNEFLASYETYIVPEGKTLYVTNIYTQYGVEVNGYQIFGGINYNGMTMGIPLILEAGDIISRTSSAGNIGYNVTFNGLLVEDAYFSSLESSSNNDNNSSNINVIYTTPFYSIDSLNLNEYEVGEIIIDKGTNSSYYVSETFNNESFSTLLLSQPSCSSIGQNDYMFYFEVADTFYFSMPYSTKYKSNFGAGWASGSFSSYQCDPLSGFNNLFYVTSNEEFDPNSHSKLAYNYDYLVPGIGYVVTLSNNVPGSYYNSGSPAYSNLSNFEFNLDFINMSFWNKSSTTYSESNYFPVLNGLGFKISQPIKTLIPLND